MDESTRGRAVRGQNQYAITPLWLIESSVSDKAIRVYGILWARWGQGMNPKPYPRQETIGRYLKCSRVTVNKAIAELVKVGAIVIEDRFDEAHRQMASVYILMHTEPVTVERHVIDPELHLVKERKSEYNAFG